MEVFESPNKLLAPHKKFISPISFGYVKTNLSNFLRNRNFIIINVE